MTDRGVTMGVLRLITDWFSGGAGHQYCTLMDCMNRDHLWIAITVCLDLAVAGGYVIIAYHWSKNERILPPSPAKTALRTMRNIFAFCGVCGYLFIPIKMFWPAWRLYDIFMVGLVFYTWRYALNTKDLKVIYSAIGRSNQLAQDLAASREESKRKSFFLNAISHDLRTPLNGLMLHANLAELHVANGETNAAENSIAEIKAGGRLTADLLDRLLEFARLETADEKTLNEIFDLNDLLRDILNSYAAMAETKSLELTATPCPGVTLCTDRLRLERVLNNLVGNAIKFTEVGSVKIEVKPLPRAVRLSVVDTGIGIAPENQQRLMEEFFQVQNLERDRRKGFGLGLAICDRLVRQLGGELEIQSVLGHGSRFSVLLPTTGATDGSVAGGADAESVNLSIIQTGAAG